MTDAIIFEQPLNERIRTFLRLEFLFKRIDTLLNDDCEIEIREVLNNLMNLLSLFERSDLKQEIIKELERHSATLTALENIAGVDTQALSDLLNQLDHTLDELHLVKSTIGQSLRDNEFLSSIRQRSTIAGGCCDFDLPAYHYWLEHFTYTDRKQQVRDWCTEFNIARKAMALSLQLIRDSIGFKQQNASEGFYQQSLDSNQANQLIRIKIPRSCDFYPEISGGKHRFSVRFMAFDLNQRPQQTDQDVAFDLSCCAI